MYQAWLYKEISLQCGREFLFLLVIVAYNMREETEIEGNRFQKKNDTRNLTALYICKDIWFGLQNIKILEIISLSMSQRSISLKWSTEPCVTISAKNRSKFHYGLVVGPWKVAVSHLLVAPIIGSW